MIIKSDDFSIPPHTLHILKQMCREIRISFKKIDFNEDRWYTKYEWTEYKQEKFKKWLVDYLYSNKDARQEILGYPYSKTKKQLENNVNYFVLNYGWKLKEKK